jgi:hypothetical protein
LPIASSSNAERTASGHSAHRAPCCSTSRRRCHARMSMAACSARTPRQCSWLHRRIPEPCNRCSMAAACCRGKAQSLHPRHSQLARLQLQLRTDSASLRAIPMAGRASTARYQ